MERKIFSMIDENGEEKIYDVLFTFKNDETGKCYIVYTDGSRDESGNIQVFASVYDPDDPTGKLEAITTDKEWEVIESILTSLQEDARKKMEEGNEQ